MRLLLKSLAFTSDGSFRENSFGPGEQEKGQVIYYYYVIIIERLCFIKEIKNIIYMSKFQR